MNGQRPSIKINFPWNLYFEQLFAADTYVRFINPFNFWHKYRIEHLETCGELDPVKDLERSYRLERQRKILNRQKQRSSKGTGLDLSHLREQTTSKTIFVIQPDVKLKYRGVEYHRCKIAGMRIYLGVEAKSTESSESRDRAFITQNISEIKYQDG